MVSCEGQTDEGNSAIKCGAETHTDEQWWFYMELHRGRDPLRASATPHCYDTCD